MGTVVAVARIAVVFAFLGIAASTVAIVKNSPLAAMIAVGIVLSGLEIIVLFRMAGGFTAAALPVLTVNGAFLAAPVLWGEIQSQAHVSLKLAASEDFHIQALSIGIVFCAAYTLGALLAGPRKMAASLTDLKDAYPIRVANSTLVVAGYAGMALSVYGWQGALLQGDYLENRGPLWAVAMSSVAIPAAILAFSIALAQGGPWRGFAAVGIALMAIILFGRASRMLALLPLLVLAAKAFMPDAKLRAGQLATAGILTTVLLQVPLAGRSNPDGVGIITLGKQLLARPEEFLSGFNLNGLVGNVLISGPQTALVANRPIPAEAFWISVNPLPGRFAGWEDIRSSLRINAYTPYNSLGELAASGWITLIGWAVAAGFLLALASRIASRLPGNYRTAASLLILAGSAFFSLLILQYNLRSSTRLVWYVFLGSIVIWGASITFSRKRVVRSREQRSKPRIAVSRPFVRSDSIV